MCPTNLKAFLRQTAPESLETFFAIAVELAEAIEFIHSRNVCHRDLKPENVLVDKAGHIKICDMGLSRYQSQTEACKTVGIGTPHYMPPEAMGASGAMEDAAMEFIGIGQGFNIFDNSCE